MKYKHIFYRSTLQNRQTFDRESIDSFNVTVQVRDDTNNVS